MAALREERHRERERREKREGDPRLPSPVPPPPVCSVQLNPTWISFFGSERSDWCHGH